MTAGPAPAPEVNTALARTLVDEWARAGLSDACLAPGSRSTPLALALAGDARVRLHVHVDERSAAFFALGVAKASGRPALVACTSGTAAAHFHAAVLEARHARVPLLVCTADRPAELRDTGAPQTIDQLRLYGPAPRFFADVAPDADPRARAAWRPLFARAFAEAAGPPAGPVHLNVAFREPLVPGAGAGGVPDVPGRPGGRPWVSSAPGRRHPEPVDVERLAALVASTERGVVAAGWGTGAAADAAERFATAAGWPLLADPLSGARRGPAAVSTYEALARVAGFADAHRADAAVRLGAALTGKAAGALLEGCAHQILVDPDGAWLDPTRSAAERVACDPAALLDAVTARLGGDRPSPWWKAWRDAEGAARAALDAFLDDAGDPPFEGRVARDAAGHAARRDAVLVVASSMPVRDVEAFARPDPGLAVLANRGVNGIDGFVSTVLGVAAARRGRPTVGLGGDLAFLHDAGGLAGAAARGVDVTVVVVDNDGGGIFSFLPQAEAVEPGRFEALFGTPHGLDLAAVARAYGATATRVERAADLEPAMEEAADAGGVRVVVVATGDRAANVVRHRLAWEAVAAAVAR